MTIEHTYYYIIIICDSVYLGSKEHFALSRNKPPFMESDNVKPDGCFHILKN